LDACRETGVKGIIHYGMGLTLRQGNREYFYRALDQHFPGLKEVYIRTYGNAYILPSPHEPQLLRQFHETCESYGIWHENEQIYTYLSALDEKMEQLSLFG